MIVTLVGLVLAFYVFVLYRGLPVPVAIFGVIALCGMFALNNTRFGRRLYAIGGNEDAARLSGINVFQTKLIVYYAILVLAALAGILLASRLNEHRPISARCSSSTPSRRWSSAAPACPAARARSAAR